MDPVEPGEWIVGRPRQLVFLTGLDPNNKPHHLSVTEAFKGNQSADRPPLQIRVVSGELDIPQKKEKGPEKGILRREWFQKYLNDVPALIAVFIDLDWTSPTWEEKKTEAESKVASIRASLRKHETRVALIMIQQRPTNEDDHLAAERAHELTQMCSLSSKHLFVLPILGDVPKYVLKLENAFHELCQGFYQAKLKNIRSRSIPNNSPALVVRQQFKMAFISELRQDTHTALRNYRLAYDQCRDSLEQWEGVDVFEWRSVVGLLNYKMCELCFLHSTALEAINQMRKHQQNFFSSAPGIYPTPQLASIELLLWKAKQCYHFAKLFEQAVKNGLSALATLNPGTHLDHAACIFSAANVEISALKRNSPQNLPYPTPDPLNTTNTTFFGQRPWRIGREGLASQEIEASAVTAIIQRLVVNHEGVVELYKSAMEQYKKYRCWRMCKKLMIEVANTHYANNDIPSALQGWAFVGRDTALPDTKREDMMHRATWASYAVASTKDFVACCLQMMCPTYSKALPSQCAKALEDVLEGRVPCSPFPNDDVSQNQLQSYQLQWQHLLAEPQEFVILASKLEPFIDVRVSFLNQTSSSQQVVMVEMKSKIEHVLRFSDVVLFCKSSLPDATDDTVFEPISLGAVEISSLQKSVKRLALLDTHKAKRNAMVHVTKVNLELGNIVKGRVEYDETSLSRSSRVENQKDPGTEFAKTDSESVDVKLDAEVTVECLIGEVASTELVLRNAATTACRNLRMEFKRSEQQFTEAAAILFVDQSGTELKSEYSMKICESLSGNGVVTIPLKLSAQLVGNYSLQLELTYETQDQTEKKRILNIELSAREPFLVNSTVLNMNGTPMSAILNQCEHILNVNVQSAAVIVISSVEFLLADVVNLCDKKQSGSWKVQDEVEEGEEVCYSTAIRVLVNEEETEIPLGRMCIEWKRSLPHSNLVRSVVPLCRIPVLACPISIHSIKETCPVTVRQPVEICFELVSHSKEALDISIHYELNDVFMFHGERKVTLTVLPGRSRRFTVCVMALSAGRLNFPKIALKSPQIAETLLQQALRTLPATIFVLPKPKCLSSPTTPDQCSIPAATAGQ